jgi:hypothetical protein
MTGSFGSMGNSPVFAKRPISLLAVYVQKLRRAAGAGREEYHVVKLFCVTALTNGHFYFSFA